MLSDIDFVLFNYRSKTRFVTGETPAKLLFYREIQRNHQNLIKNY